MNRLSPLAQYLYKVLKSQKRPQPMSWLMDRAYRKFLGRKYPGYVRDGDLWKVKFHQKIKNAVNNGCACPKNKPRFTVIKKDGKTLFKANK